METWTQGWSWSVKLPLYHLSCNNGFLKGSGCKNLGSVMQSVKEQWRYLVPLYERSFRNYIHMLLPFERYKILTNTLDCSVLATLTSLLALYWPSTRLNTSLLADNLVHISHRLGLCLNNTFSDDLPWLSMILLVFPLYSVDCTHLESLFKPSLLCSLGGWQNQIHPLGSQILSSGHRGISRVLDSERREIPGR